MSNKLVYLILLISIVALSCNNVEKGNATTQVSSHQDKIIEAITQVNKGFKQKDSLIINSLIHPEYGLFVIHRVGAYDHISNVEKVNYDKTIDGYLSFPSISEVYNLVFDSLPTYSCETGKWSKQGLYCDLSYSHNFLSNVAQSLIQYRGDEIDEKTLQVYQTLDKQNIRVVLNHESGDELVYHLSKLDGKWYLTVLDMATSDCSA